MAMKKIIIVMLLSMSFYTSKAQNCINFSNYTPGMVSNWKGFFVASTTIQTDIPHGKYLQLTDDEGGSRVMNETEFGGNWLSRAINGCLCFDYNVNWNSDNSINTIPVKEPKIGIYTGTTATNNYSDVLNRIRASFVGNSTNPDLQDNVWRNFCLPIGLSVNGSLPSNSFGTWVISNGSTPLLGAAACTAWDNLIQNVTGCYFATDYNGSPTEKINLDNFCWTCASPICNCSSFIKFTESPYVITPDGGKLTAPSCERSLGSILNAYTPYQFAVGFQSYNTAGCTTEYSATITNSNNVVIASQISTNGVVPLSYTFSQSGDYSITYSLKVNGVVCTTCKMVFRVELEPNPCCINTFSFWTDIAVPESYPFSEGTYSVEDFLVKGANTIPITELKVTVENFELISQYADCLKCYNLPATLGSILGGITIGNGSNKLTLETQPYGNGNQLAANINEVIWKNPNGVTLNTTDSIRLIYILPGKSEIPCCVDSVKVCVRFSYRDINGGYCEAYNCTIVPLRSKGTNTLPTLQQLFQNSRGVFNPSKAPGF